jgi:hypothetical protein
MDVGVVLNATVISGVMATVAETVTDGLAFAAAVMVTLPPVGGVAGAV